MQLVLQLWGGGFFLLNKIFFWKSEQGQPSARKWKIAAWSVYLIGLPAWLVIFFIEHNWIAMSLEASGSPSMLLGLLVAIRGKGKTSKWIDRLALLGIIVGFSLSLYDFGGLTKYTQYLELALVTGYLVGTYMLANKNARGYIGYMVMNTANAFLMWEQGYPWLMLQQVVSFGFVAAAYVTYLNQPK